MPFEVANLPEGFATVRASEWLFTCVQPHVVLERAGVGKHLVTHTATTGPWVANVHGLHAMDLLVNPE